MEEIPPLIISSIFNSVELLNLDIEVLIYLIIVVVLIICSSFISGAEVAYFSLSSSELDDLAKEKKGNVVLKLLKNPNQLLATILIANNFINIGVVLFSYVLTSLVISFNGDRSLEFIIQVLIITVLLEEYPRL